jgi:hypothetical protein
MAASRCSGPIGLVVASAAAACPVCHTETGRQVREGIFGADFGFYLLVTAMPFVVLLGITALIYFGLPRGLRLGGGFT